MRCLSDHSITKQHPEFYDVFQYIYRGTCFALVRLAVGSSSSCLISPAEDTNVLLTRRPMERVQTRGCACEAVCPWRRPRPSMTCYYLSNANLSLSSPHLYHTPSHICTLATAG